MSEELIENWNLWSFWLYTVLFPFLLIFLLWVLYISLYMYVAKCPLILLSVFGMIFALFLRGDYNWRQSFKGGNKYYYIDLDSGLNGLEQPQISKVLIKKSGQTSQYMYMFSSIGHFLKREAHSMWPFFSSQ